MSRAIYNYLARLCGKIIFTAIKCFSKVSENSIVILNKSNSGSNAIALFKSIPEHIKKQYTVSFINENKYKGIKGFSKKHKILLTSHILITTHGPLKYKKKQINMELWHGFPLKGMGAMHKLLPIHQKKKYIKDWNKCDYMVSYSQLFNTLMNSCTGAYSDKYIIAGAPRNDFLFYSNGKKTLSEITGLKLSGQTVIFYFPTFRQESAGIIDNVLSINNPFGLKNFNIKSFDLFMEKYSMYLFIKPHPNAKDAIFTGQDIVTERIKFINDDMLQKNNIDLYEIINGVDVLITDYSSIYFDYLLLDRPLIFIPHDLNYYQETRGFLLEPYDFWTPGPKVFNQNDLQKEIIENIKNPEKYNFERMMICSIVHDYKDGNSSWRVWNNIEKILNEFRLHSRT